jgi:L-threonylcarbamoyladenylate synthase
MNEDFEKDNLLEVKSFLEDGKIIILQTDTILGLACLASSKNNIDKLFEIKKRDQKKSFSIFCKKNDIEKYANIETEWQKKLIQNFIPGKITFILKSKNKIFEEYGISKNNKIGIRIPNIEFWIKILNNLNYPLVVTSVNISSESPALNFKEINHKIFEHEDVIKKEYKFIENNFMFSNIPSSIFDISDKDIKNIECIRVGCITKHDILNFIKELY